MKVLKWKFCDEDVEVPENRLSAICADCAGTHLAKKDIEGAIEKLKINIEKCNHPAPNETNSRQTFLLSPARPPASYS